MKFLIPGILGWENLAHTIFLEGLLDLSRDVFGYPKQSEDFVITLFGMVNIQTQTLNLECFYFLCYIILMFTY